MAFDNHRTRRYLLTVSDDAWLSHVKFNADGLVPVVAQERRTGDVLMLAYADQNALRSTRASGFAHYFSRSRRAPWRKGETSGHVQRVREIRLDCDGDTVLYEVDQTGPACHTGDPTCFTARVTSEGAVERTPAEAAVRRSAQDARVLDGLAARIDARAAERPQGSYTARLLDEGTPAVAQKMGEEAVEVVVAALAQDDGRLVAESADLLYHLLVLLRARAVPAEQVWAELSRRSAGGNR
ncbi:MAG TPA: bifunctional phosphoribosyl-AMP cyclohydrolase/phosphoribosyl-ATP diphosphatase HisIE [Gemmatimonadales bacterium]|nr:bifunctional phosphoribosyl-AMP cyclohydrolase/phosphoribosyl-ATP diphosphatase HisIE [Gemmatimonadales bacterium]